MRLLRAGQIVWTAPRALLLSKALREPGLAVVPVLLGNELGRLAEAGGRRSQVPGRVPRQLSQDVRIAVSALPLGWRAAVR
jgi:hypothetical protein